MNEVRCLWKVVVFSILLIPYWMIYAQVNSICLYIVLNKKLGSLYSSGKLPTYPSPKPTLTLTSHLWPNVDLGEG